MCVARAAFVMLAAALTACGGNSEAPTSECTRLFCVPEPPSPFSYDNFKHRSALMLPAGDNTVRAYPASRNAYFFRAVPTYDKTSPPAEATPSHFEFWTLSSAGVWTQQVRLLPLGADGCVHPRKAVVADFNGDGVADIFVACQGYDAAPFPGETNRIVLSQPDGTFVIKDVPAHSGYNSGATTADLNGDGKVDVVVTDKLFAQRAYVLLGDGAGGFKQETTARLPSALTMGGGSYLNVELADVNRDGNRDLLVGGNEWENAPTSVFLNPGNFDFTSAQPIVLPPVAGQGVVLDFMVVRGDARPNVTPVYSSPASIWLSRTSGDATSGSTFQSRVVQRVDYPSLNSTVVLNQEPGPWIPWLIEAVSSDKQSFVITSDNAAEMVSFPD